MKIQLKDIWVKSKWHLLAAVFTFLITWFGNTANFLYLAEAYAEQIKGTQYGFQLLICTGGTFLVAFVVEVIQGFMGANKTTFEWENNGKPDILVSTAAGFIGSLSAIIIFLS